MFTIWLHILVLVKYTTISYIFVDLLEQQIHELLDKSTYNRQLISKRSVVRGKAGSGKTTVIQRMVEIIYENIGEDGVIVAAPTGVAALNIGGVTLHNAFRLNFAERELPKLSNVVLRELQEKYRNTQFVIIDEMSMIGTIKLAQIDHTLKQIKSCPNEPFGGIRIYLFGDYRQLPPIGDPAVYSSNIDSLEAAIGKELFTTFEKSIELKTSHRQKSDREFSSLLERLGSSKISVEDYSKLSTRASFAISRVERESFNNAVFLCATKEKVHRKNQSELSKTDHPVVKLQCDGQSNIKYNGPKELTGGLEEELFLSIGTKVMLLRNLWVKGGLVNGSIGYVRGIV